MTLLDQDDNQGHFGLSLTEVRDEERIKFVRGLHDMVGPKLTALSLMISTLNIGLVSQQTDQKTTDLLFNAQSLTEEIGYCIRNLMVEIQPPEIDETGLMPYLSIYKSAFAQRTGIDVTFSEQSFPELPPAVLITLFRIVREAMVNAAEHSGAKHIAISLTADEETVCAAIVDDGSGFDVERRISDCKGRNGGLNLMKKRVEAIGGRLKILSTPGKGTSIVVEVNQ